MKTKFLGFLLVLLAVVFTACGPTPTGETGTEIIEASTVQELLQDPATILIDARPLVEYRRGCVDGALNISTCRYCSYGTVFKSSCACNGH
jgi:predicted sulfurtransferase